MSQNAHKSQDTDKRNNNAPTIKPIFTYKDLSDTGTLLHMLCANISFGKTSFKILKEPNGVIMLRGAINKHKANKFYIEEKQIHVTYRSILIYILIN